MSAGKEDYRYHLHEELRAGRLTRREFLRLASIAGISIPAASAMLAACGTNNLTSTTGAAAKPRSGGTLRVGTTGAGSSVDPVTAYNPGGLAIIQMAGEYLCIARNNFTLEPILATKWSSDSAAKSWTFELRQGVKFQDGRPMTVDDVVTTFERLVGPKSESAALSAFQGILSPGHTEAGPGNAVTFHLDRPFVDFPYLVSNYNYNTVILPKDYKPNSFIKGKIGTGPFILTEYVPLQRTTFVRNPDYWGKPKPYLDGISVIQYGDTAPMVLALENRSIGYITALDYEDARTLLASSKATMHVGKATSWRALAMRVDRHPFTDQRVREAIALLLNRPDTVKALLGGYGLVGNDFAFPPTLDLTPTTSSVPQRRQDLKKAKSLLAAAGYPNGFTVTLTTENYLEIPSYVTLLKSEAAKVGVNIKLDIMTPDAYYGSGSNQPWLEVPFGCTEWATRPDGGQNVEPLYLSNGIWNEAHYKNPVLDRTMIAYDGELDVTKRKELALKACKIMHDDVPVVIAYWIDTLIPTLPNVGGVNVNAPTPADWHLTS